VVWIGQVQEPHKGCLGWPTLRCGSGGARRRSIDTLRRRRIRWVTARTREARERRPGEVWVKVFVAGPKGANPMGGASGPRLKTPCGRQALSEGVDPGTEACRAGLTLRRRKYRWAERYVGSSPVETPRTPSERGNLRRVNPRSAAGVKQNRRGIRGSKPSRG